MAQLLELRERLMGFYGKYDIYVQPVVKLFTSLLVFMTINANLGFDTRLSSLPITFILALICSILPAGVTIAFAAVLILVHLYALALEVAVIALGLFFVIAMLYLRFSPKEGWNFMLTPVCIGLHIGGIVPIATGLLCEFYASVSVVCGTVIYYFLEGIALNASMLSDGAEEGGASKFAITLKQLYGNKEMMLVVITFLIVTLVVGMIRRMSVDHAWSIAIVIGTLLNFIIRMAGYFLLGIPGKILMLIIGSIVSMLIAFLIQFFCFNLDYTRTERVQFEDDEYYYYVKAIPKLYVAEPEKQVKKFSTSERKKTSERISRKQISEEMGIDEKFLK